MDGKRLRDAKKSIEREKLYPIEQAVKLIKERAKAKFDETIEIAMNLGVDPRHADQMVRGVCALPNGTGRTVRVAVLPAAGRPRRQPRPEPTSSARKSLWRKFRPATSISISASPRPT